MQKVFEHTARSLSQFTSFINSIFTNNDENIIDFCRAEYGRDWQWAYSTYKKQGRFPNHLDTYRKAA
jgi:hypothetical protein